MLSLESGARDASRVAVRLRHAANQVDDRVWAVTRHYGTVLRQRVVARAPKRTGRYASRIRTDVMGGTRDRYIKVGSPDPFARRLEKGFVGEDRLGRTFNQPPQEHFGPAVDQTGPEYEAAIARVIVEGLE